MKKPFFAKFLENQISETIQNKVKAGNHESGPQGTGGCEGVALEHNPACYQAVTLKYPCDAADAGQPCH